MIQFTKKQDAINFDLLYWLLSARDNKPMPGKESFALICVDNKDLICTNGALLHLLKKPEINLEDGWYKIIRKSKSEIIIEKTEPEILNNYSDFREVIPFYNAKTWITLPEIKKTSIYGISKAIFKIYNHFPNVCLNLDYVDKILDDLSKNYREFTVSIEKEMIFPKVLFENEYQKALLMCMNIKK